jgi:leader peptidase (prepilin peptidase)/N-methyltransferase
MLAAFLGSFLNVCISRLPVGQSVVFPASRCPHCETPIRVFDNVPLISFIFLGGRCRACRARISWRYPIVEAISIALGGLVVWRFGLTWDGLRAFVLALLLLAVTVTDLEHHLIPNRITLPGLAAGLLLRLYPLPRAVLDGLLGALVGGGIFFLIAWLSPKVFGKEGMGFGDVKLAAMMGGFLGLAGVLVAVFVGIMAGGIVSILLLALGLRRFGEYLAFGPFLALGGLVALLWGPSILEWYLG